ncbi:hypothetical protein DFH08DRAFT_829297 [Mycena albidolilacea]|uniref:F-box domain-containing protein n=1 Tax=Mycena albidolilacea TaxID=1033008 RepID=A0AAD7ATD6_9AGAR|nr:hypothetical protein DFH08DRAFT_829297 [Mycena albidolilacea]
MSSPAADHARLAHLNAQISLLTRALWDLHSEKRRVLVRLDSYKYYPVLTLPAEIVSEIFLHCLPIYPLFPPLLGPSSPTVLTQICRKWREIALTTPALWRAISLSELAIPIGEQAKLVDTWLTRSRCLPVHFQFSNRFAPSRAAEVLASVVPHRARWEYLDLHHLPPSHVHIVAGPMPLLRRLEWLPHNPTTKKFACREVPLLRTAVLNDVAAGSVILPWVQLTSLTLLRVYPEECVPILQHTFNLVHCQLALVARYDDEDTLPDITLPYLRSLTLDGDALGTEILEALIVPALHDLRIAESFFGSNIIDALASFLLPSRCLLQELCITDRAVVSKKSYRKAFPSINISFAKSL